MSKELAKFADAAPSMQVIREFLEWLDAQSIDLAKLSPHGSRYLLHMEDREAMLHRYFNIDAVRLETERRALLRRVDSAAKTE